MEHLRLAADPVRNRAAIGVWGVIAALLLAASDPAAGDPRRVEGKHPLEPHWDLTPHEKLYSQFNEELIVRHFFADSRAGIFVDVGCSHWKKHSTTYFLEAHLGWSGVGIDALPQLARGYRENRRRTRFLNYIVTDHSGGMETLHVGGPISSTSKERVDRRLPDRRRDPIS